MNIRVFFYHDRYSDQGDAEADFLKGLACARVGRRYNSGQVSDGEWFICTNHLLTGENTNSSWYIAGKIVKSTKEHPWTSHNWPAWEVEFTTIPFRANHPRLKELLSKYEEYGSYDVLNPRGEGQSKSEEFKQRLLTILHDIDPKLSTRMGRVCYP
jgi:hypothetical protein